MKINEAIVKLAKALRRAVDEHGADGNTFGAGELEEYGGPPATLAGRIGHAADLRARLHEAMGGAAWGEAPTYAARRWHVGALAVDVAGGRAQVGAEQEHG